MLSLSTPLDESKKDTFARYEDASELRVKAPKACVKHLDLSYCRELSDKELKLIRSHSSIELESLDLSGCQSKISFLELNKFFSTFSSLSTLRLHEWKLDGMFLKTVMAQQRLRIFGVSAVLETPAKTSSEKTSTSLQLYSLFTRQLEVTNFETYNEKRTGQRNLPYHLVNYNSPFIEELELPMPTSTQTNGNEAPTSTNRRGFRTMLAFPLNNLSAEATDEVVTSSNTSTTILHFFCPMLQTISLLFRQECGVKEIVMFILSIAESCASSLEEVHLYIPSNLYKNVEKLQLLTLALPDLLPTITFSIVRSDEDLIRRRLARTKEEQSSAYHEMLETCTQVKNNSIAVDLLKGYTDRPSFPELCDTKLLLAPDYVVPAHSAILESRCPALLKATKKPLFKSTLSADLFMKYLYSDMILSSVDIPFLLEKQNKKENNTKLTKEEVEAADTLQSLNQTIVELLNAAQQFRLTRLEKLCTLLFNIIAGSIEDPDIPGSTIESDMNLAHQKIPIFQDDFKDTCNPHEIILRAPIQLSEPSRKMCIQVNKFLICSRCPYFGGLFGSRMKESTFNVLDFNDTPFESLRSLVQFIYTGTCTFDETSAVETFMLADRMGLPTFQQQCLSHIQSNLNNSNVIQLSCKVYRLVVNSPVLTDICFNYFNTHALLLFQRHDEIQNLDWQMLRVFLSYIYNYLLEEPNDDKNTVALQCAVLRSVLIWIKKQCSGANTSLNFETLRTQLQSVLRYVHTNRISPVDFAGCLMSADIFQRSQIFKAFTAVGVVLEDEDEERAKKFAKGSLRTSGPRASISCNTCMDWGYIRLPVPCTKCQGMLSRLGFCSWCSSTGTTMQMGPPCKNCIIGNILELKSMFDHKVLDECIRIHIPAYQQNQQPLTEEDEM